MQIEIEIEHDLTQRATEAKQNETTDASAFEESSESEESQDEELDDDKAKDIDKD